MFVPPPLPSGDVLNIADKTILRSAVSGAETATYQLTTGGRIFYNTSSGTDATSDKGPWVTPNADGTRYECFATVTSGTLSSGTAGSWLDLGAANRTWTRAGTGGTSTVCTFTLALRLKGTTTTLKTVTITLDTE